MSRFALLFSILTASACFSAPASSPNCPEGKCDGFDLPESEVPETACDGVMFDHSGRGLGTSKIAGRLGDPAAKLVFRSGDDCPIGFADIMAKIVAAEKTDELECEGEDRRTMFVSESAQVLDKPTSYRAVTAVDCKQKVTETISNDPTDIPPFVRSSVPGIMFSSFGLQPDGALPSNVEIIAFDANLGIFNYYETDGQRVNFFGSSKDMLNGVGSSGDRRCAGCHTSGGLIMKELDAPWLHWEGDTDTPGTEDMIAAHQEVFGELSDGIEMEQITRDGNDAWNRTRLGLLRDVASTKDVLRPLFCTEQINIANGSSSPGDSRSGKIRSLSLEGGIVDGRLGFGRFSDVNDEQYDAVLRANGQRLQGLPAEFIETHFGLASIVNGAVSEDYIERLVEAEMVDGDFVKAIKAVDMTRAVFSDDRCGLLEFAPSLTLDELTVADVTQGFIENLEQANPAAGTPEAEFLRNLKLEEKSDLNTIAENFEAACTARTDVANVAFDRDGNNESLEVPQFVLDYMQVTSARRDQARTLEVMEFPMTVPSDNLNVEFGTRFDPNSCELTTSFVSATLPATDSE